MKFIILGNGVVGKGRLHTTHQDARLEDVGVDDYVCFNVTINSCYL